MNSNKSLVGLFCCLTLFAIMSAVSCSGSNHQESLSSNNELFMTNIRCIPGVIRSYESIKNIYGRKNTLFFRYVNTSCSSCTDIYLNEILSFQEEIGKDNVWIFPAYPNDRMSRIRLSADLEKFNYKNIPRDSLIIPMHEGEEKSYFAWINNEGEIDMVFFPDKGKALLTRDYFLEVKRKLSQKAEKN
jgi:hypothetical protein